MKKIFVGVLSVAGLLAALLAVAGTPASAAVGLIEAADDDTTSSTIGAIGGTYTVSWTAKAGCDQSQNGSITRVIKDDAGPDTGDEAERRIGSYRTSDNCNYDVTATFVAAEGAIANVDKGTRCAASVDADPNTVIRASGLLTVTVDDTDCVVKSQVVVTVDGADADDSDDAAVLARTWTVTATPTGKGADDETASAAAECAEVSGTTKKTGDPEKQVVTLKPIAEGLEKDGTDTSCSYDISVALQDGYEERTKDSSKYLKWDAGDELNEDGDVGSSALTFNLKVAKREIYVVQSVQGDAGGGQVQYNSTVTCAAAGFSMSLPTTIDSSSTAGGIVTVKAKSLVPLNTGRYDVTAGIMGATASTTTGFSGRQTIAQKAVATDGKACTISLSVDTGTPIPDNCSASTMSQMLDLSDAKAQNIIEFAFVCLPPASEMPAAADGEGDGMLGAEDDPADPAMADGDGDGADPAMSDGDGDGADPAMSDGDGDGADPMGTDSATNVVDGPTVSMPTG